MLDSNTVFLFGYSGHAFVIIESLFGAGFQIKGYFDFKPAENNPYNLEYFGYEKDVDVNSIVGSDFVFPSVGDNLIRNDLITLFEKRQLKELAIKDGSANVSSTALIRPSTYIGKNVTVNAQTEIGKGVVLNTGCVIEHECEIANHVHIAPGAVLCGNVAVGEGSYIGANSVVKQNVNIGANIIIGAGSVVLWDIEESGTWAGNKLRKL